MFWHWVLVHTGVVNPINEWYNFWSGFGSDVGEIAIVGGLVTMVRHHNCHVKGCKRLGHMDPAVHAPACGRHHSHRELRGRVWTSKP